MGLDLWGWMGMAILPSPLKVTEPGFFFSTVCTLQEMYANRFKIGNRTHNKSIGLIQNVPDFLYIPMER